VYDHEETASLAALPEQLIDNPDDDVLSGVLSSIRLSGSLQFCFMPAVDWQTDDKPAFNKGESSAGVMPFHIMVEGSCWLKMPDHTVDLMPGDIVAFPFGTGHQLGHGKGGGTVNPTTLLPPKPWREIPVLHYGEGPSSLRLLCGYLQCDAMDFRPLRKALPTLLHMRTGGTDEAHWLRATIAQIVSETDRPRTGGQSMLERLTEIIFIASAPSDPCRRQRLGGLAGGVGRPGAGALPGPDP